MFVVTSQGIVIKRRALGMAVGVLGVLLAAALACNAGARGGDSSIPPQAPTGLAASLPAARQIALTWSDNSDNEAGFVVRRVDPAGQPTELGQAQADATTYTDGSIACGMVYQYTVAATNASGTSAETCVEVTVPEQCDDPAQAITTGPCMASAQGSPSPTTEAGEPTLTHTPVTLVVPTVGAGTNTPTQNPPTFTPPPPTATATPACGDGTCNGSENPATCPGDCPASCGDTLCTGGENAGTCPADCPDTCGDSVCSGPENASTCNADCPDTCGDGYCTGTENFSTCSDDCTLIFIPPITYCGDGTCNGSENFSTCAADCPLILIPLDP